MVAVGTAGREVSYFSTRWLPSPLPRSSRAASTGSFDRRPYGPVASRSSSTERPTPGKPRPRKRRTSFAGDESGGAFLEALLVILASALVLVYVRGALVGGATGLVQQSAGISWSREWVMFDAAARRSAEEVELRYWDVRPRSALTVSDGGMEVVYDAAGVERRFAVVVSDTLEIRVDGRLAAALSGVDDVGLEPWIAAGGGLLGIVVRLEGPEGIERSTHLRFGTPGGTL
jgi:hypothetical protein